MKIDIESIQAVLKEQQIDSQTIGKVVKSLQKIVEDEKMDRAESKVPKAKNEYFCIVLDNEGKIVAENHTALLGTVQAGFDLGTLLGKMQESAKEFNQSKKGKRNPLISYSDIFSVLPRKISKKFDFLPKTKDGVRVFAVKNDLPAPSGEKI